MDEIFDAYKIALNRVQKDKLRRFFFFLKEENAKLKQQLADYGTIKTENERLKEILNITELDADIELIDAGVKTIMSFEYI